MPFPMPGAAAPWSTGPLADPALEQLALKVFARTMPMACWGDPAFSTERNACRRFVLQLQAEFRAIDRWSPSTAAERLAAETAHIVFGARPLGRTIRGEITAIAEAYVSDLWLTFRHRLLLPADIARNQQEVNEEAAQS